MLPTESEEPERFLLVNFSQLSPIKFVDIETLEQVQVPMFTHKTPIPTEEDLNFVHPAPLKTLHPGVPADKFYHLVMKEKLWSSWSGDSHGVKYFDDPQKDFECDIKGHVMTIRDRMIIKDSHSDEVVGVLLQMHMKWETTFKIYGLRPYNDEVPQAPSKEQKYEGKDLYEWAECKDKFFSVQKTMTFVDGVKYVMDGVGKVFAGRRQMRITRDGVPCAHFQEKTLGILKGNQWEIKIAPGIDPVVIIAFNAIMDEMNEGKG